MNTFGRGRSRSTWSPAAYAEDSELSSSRWEYIFSKMQEKRKFIGFVLGFYYFCRLFTSAYSNVWVFS